MALGAVDRITDWSGTAAVGVELLRLVTNPQV